jgi:Zn finger protein HypA/HybF involved in hydrogenase expression
MWKCRDCENIFVKHPKKHTCPKCNSIKIHKIHKRLIEPKRY